MCNDCVHCHLQQDKEASSSSDEDDEDWDSDTAESGSGSEDEEGKNASMAQIFLKKSVPFPVLFTTTSFVPHVLDSIHNHSVPSLPV